MADNVVGIKFGVAGGSSISGESGQLIKSQLEELSKKIQLKVNIDKDHFTKQLTSLKAELEKTLGELKITIKTDNVTATQGNGGTSSGGARGSSANSQASAYANLQRQLEQLATAQSRLAKLSSDGGVAYEITKRKVDELSNAYIANRLQAMSNGEITEEQSKQLNTYADDLQKVINKEQERANTSSRSAKSSMRYAKLQRNAMSLYTDGGFDKVIARSKEAKDMVDAFNAEVKKIDPNDEAGIKRLNLEFIKTQSELKRIQKETDTLGNKLKDIFTSKILQTFAYAIIGIGTRALKQLYQNVVDLDSAITDLQIASGKTREETEELIKTYSKLAKQLGATTLEVAQSADTWLRQGYSIEEANTLIQASMMLSKLGQIESAEASKALTSAMKGYKIEVSEATDIVDKFTAVDMEAAVSAGDIATAMAETATSADIAGISMNKLIGYIATVSEVTQDSAESVGTFYKTLFARMNNVAAGNFIDEETGESLNDVETVLGELGIALRDSNGLFRSSGEVLDDVASRWENFDNVQQHAIATAFAGTRQQEKFIVLMENYGDAMEYAATAADSAGTAQEKYTEAYVEGIDAALNRLTTSWEEFSMTVLDSSLVTGLVDLLSGIVDLLTGIASIADGMLITIPAIVVALYALYAIILKIKASTVFTTMWAGLKSVLAIFPALIAGFNSVILKIKAQAMAHQMTTAALNAQAASTQAATAAQQAFNATNPIGWIILAVTAIYGLSKAFDALSASQKAAIEDLKEEAEKQDALVEKYDTEIDELNKLRNSLEEAHGNKKKLAAIYDELNQRVSVSTQLLNGEEAAYIAVNQQLADQIEYTKTLREEANKAAIAAKRSQFNDTTITRKGSILYNDLFALTSVPIGKDIPIIGGDWYAYDAQGDQIRELMRDGLYDEFYNQKDETQQNQWLAQNGMDREDWDAYWEGQVSLAKEVFADKIENADGWFGQEFMSGAVEQLTMNGFDLDEIDAVLDNLVNVDGELETLLNNYYISLANNSEDSAALYEQLQSSLNNLKTTYPELANLIDSFSSSISTNITVVDENTSIELKSMGEMLDETQDQFDLLSDAMEEMSSCGVLTADTIRSLTEEFPELLEYVEETAEGFVLLEDALPDFLTSVRDAYTADIITAQAYFDSVYAAYEASAEKTEEAYDEVIKAQEQLENAVANAENWARVEATLTRDKLLEQYNDLLDKQIDALDKQADAYSELCDLRKDLLETYEEELTYQRELNKKQQTVSTLRTQLDVAKLDTSAAGQARVRELEKQLQEAQEDLDEYTLEHAVEQLTREIEESDKEYQLWIQRQIADIESTITEAAKLTNEAIESAITNLGERPVSVTVNTNSNDGSSETTTEESKSNASSAIESGKTSAGQTVSKPNTTVKPKTAEEQMAEDIVKFGDASGRGMNAGKSGDNGVITWGGKEYKVQNSGTAYDSSTPLYKAAVNVLGFSDRQIFGYNGKVYGYLDGHIQEIEGRTISKKGYNNFCSDVKANYGTYHTGGFVGDLTSLKSNEEFAKLMKGEFVSTPAQMQRFMDETLPNLAGGGGTSNEFNAPLINIECDNVTSEAMPALKSVVDEAVKEVKKQLDDGMSRTGYKTTKKRLLI